ncbi:unnamed protein product [Spirodela intermedia]|uniref:Gluconokinase n=1 Tax=Spirodela intermedia TaxID=51605 RepID=A0A7I8JWA9_SPIIN|nr:unnamed protein product [Spirodela intermedia]CAA6673762.1 unnamed protein product [Spirodela intermedia]
MEENTEKSRKTKLMARPGKIIVIMGVSGSGKTTIGRRLAENLGCTFLDGDDFHPQANIGIPLSEDDREPWLVTLRDASLERLSAGETAVVVACSALQKSYREVFRAPLGPRRQRNACRVSFICLEAPASVLAARLELRSSAGSHFMPPSLLPSQLALLQVDEEEEGLLRVDSTKPLNDILGFIRLNLHFV